MDIKPIDLKIHINEMKKRRDNHIKISNENLAQSTALSWEIELIEEAFENNLQSLKKRDK